MADPYARYAATSERDSRAAFAGYYPSEGPVLTSRHLWSESDLRGSSSEYLPSDKLPSLSGGYGLNDKVSLGSRGTPGLGSLAPGARGLAPLEDAALLRRDVPLGINPGIADIERSTPLRKSVGLPSDESNMLFVDGLPHDCTRREASHLFRPFIGFKEIRVVHREPRRLTEKHVTQMVNHTIGDELSVPTGSGIGRASSDLVKFQTTESGDRAQVLCFVEFNDAKCALTALEALQGYKFDDKKHDAPSLRIQFAKFPFRPPVRDNRRP